MASLSCSFVVLVFLAVAVETRPPPQRDDRQVWSNLIIITCCLVSSSSVSMTLNLTSASVSVQVLDSLFGSRLSSLILAPPTSDDITEGSAGRPAPSPSPPLWGLAVHIRAAKPLAAGRQEAVPRFFLDFLQRQAKMKRRSRKSMMGGRGCFGMKMDRIGSISGLGC